MVIAVLVSRFAFSCDDRVFWSLECWLFGYALKMLDWMSFLTLATLMLYRCYVLMEKIGDAFWKQELTRQTSEQELKAIVRPAQR
jgi:hypothetical protein